MVRIEPPGGRWATYSLKKPQKWLWIFFSPHLETLFRIQPYTSYVTTSLSHSADSSHIFIEFIYSFTNQYINIITTDLRYL